MSGSGREAQAANEPDRSQLHPHRCNDRVEDFIFALFEGEPTKNLPRPWRLMWQCFGSKVGEEPAEPFSFLKLNSPKTTSEIRAEDPQK